uniref:Zinc finger, CCHC-type n=1 Tax=Tanacetum cinerariifolium TaxID=118510 RepID=A0A699K9L6_TANCI|nr:zinc finger, CCHC-type [Tanacetum cinerariifolium]
MVILMKTSIWCKLKALLILNIPEKYASFKDPFMVLSKHQGAVITDLMRIKKFRFTQNRDEPCVYQKAGESNVTFLILYVDDIIIMGNHIPSLQSVKTYLGKCFAMKYLGEATFILGIKIYRDRSRNPEAKLRVECYYDAGFETDRVDTKSQTRYVSFLIEAQWTGKAQSNILLQCLL